MTDKMTIEEALTAFFGSEITVESWNNTDSTAKINSLRRVIQGIELQYRAMTIDKHEKDRRNDAVNMLRSEID